MSEPAAYRDNQSFLCEVIALGESLVQQLILCRQYQNGNVEAKEDNDSLLKQVQSLSSKQEQSSIHESDIALQAIFVQIDARLQSSFQQGIFIPFVQVRQQFNLSKLDQHLLLLSLLPVLDRQFQEILHSLQGSTNTQDNDIELSVSLAGEFLKFNNYDGEKIQHRLLLSCTLRHWQLVQVAETKHHGVTHFYIGGILSDYIRSVAAPVVTFGQILRTPDFSASTLFIKESEQQKLTLLTEHFHSHGEKSLIFNLQAVDKSLLIHLSVNWLRQFGFQATLLDCQSIVQQYSSLNRNLTLLAEQLRITCRDALLCNQVLVLTNAQVMSIEENDRSLWQEVLNLLSGCFRFLLLINAKHSLLRDLIPNQRQLLLLNFPVSLPDYKLRHAIWLHYRHVLSLSISDKQLQELASAYLFSHDQIQSSIHSAQGQSLLDEDNYFQTLTQSCRQQNQQDLYNIATKVSKKYVLTDIILPESAMLQLQEVLNYARYRHQVVEEWGFETKHQQSQNLCVLFHGPSGTGKTMAASVIANELHLNLYKVDLSTLVSKYIGETEKNLAILFDQAEAMNIVLFFDEAESLFGKRTESKDSHDRYANLQTGYLLQRIESYQGVVILSTNLMKNIDSGFTRRFKFIVEYPFPDAPQRKLIWQKAFPEAAPLDADIDFELLAYKAALTGGSINNIAIKSAFLSAADNLPVNMTHLLQATQQEYEKQGKVFVEAEFGWLEED